MRQDSINDFRYKGVITVPYYWNRVEHEWFHGLPYTVLNPCSHLVVVKAGPGDERYARS